MIKSLLAFMGLMIVLGLLLPRGDKERAASAGTFSSVSAPASGESGTGAEKVRKTAKKEVVFPAGNGFGSVRLKREADGHFYTNATVNGVTIRFLVDTGASSVALTRADAQRLGIATMPADFTEQASTAAGPVAVKPVSLATVSVGPLQGQNVSGVVVEQGLSESLLGQSWLKRVGNITVTGDVMELR